MVKFHKGQVFVGMNNSQTFELVKESNGELKLINQKTYDIVNVLKENVRRDYLFQGASC